MKNLVKDLVKAFCGVVWTVAIIRLVIGVWTDMGILDKVCYAILGIFLTILVWDFAINRLFSQDS